ncbi:C-type lectin lectoxin-Lei1-like isoform X1 [Crotalus tigris]|uniref:C-type lectin lectoxin-Lei1-like isoform X1 n=1 Tax=Crotalus tigris TaxID=88082 RepID=UPI00192F51CB|nr:C-type lectin lectoxin-Lei1-like isoform X1 [Crotalus tigris]XP_039174595.1 C-type lectin lectoxin-Lei1-like isoform X1 [Crotalus tigris]XP_039174596.1 C-type lectin lectoxin-Lei1-like isoform X1 [Crotalus tigris]
MGRFICVSFGLLVVFLSLSGTGADSDCPSGWSFFQQHCYRVFKQRMNWADAERSCSRKAEGGHLASIQSLAESAYVAQLASSPPRLSNVWIGLSGTGKPFQKPTWQWSDGSPFGYQSWKRRQPDNLFGIEYCVELSLFSGYLQWNDQRCGSWRYFVCKFQPQVEGSS